MGVIAKKTINGFGYRRICNTKKIDMLENSQSKDHAFALEVSICRTFNRKIMMSFLHTKEWCLNKKYIDRYVFNLPALSSIGIKGTLTIILEL